MRVGRRDFAKLLFAGVSEAAAMLRTREARAQTRGVSNRSFVNGVHPSIASGVLWVSDGTKVACADPGTGRYSRVLPVPGWGNAVEAGGHVYISAGNRIVRLPDRCA